LFRISYFVLLILYQFISAEPYASDMALRGVGSTSRRPRGPGFSGLNKISVIGRIDFL
jgi:hypothetical protein